MSYSPTTPEKSRFDPGKGLDLAPSTDEQGLAAKGKQTTSLHEPSPASTYGDTAAGDSVPATPLEDVSHEPTSSVNRSAKCMHLTPLTDATDLESMTATASPIHPIYGLSRHPGSNQSRRAMGVLEHRIDPAAGPLLQPKVKLSPITVTGSMGNFTHRLEFIGSPSRERCEAEDGAESPLPQREQDASGFVVHGKDSKVDDPFVSPTHHQPGTPSHHSSGTLSHHSQALTPSKASNNTSVKQLSPRPDRVGQLISADNAQAVLPPEACVFVANLSSIRSDEQLEYSVTRAFEAFGNVYVKIRRDNRGMPYAFCQYENKNDAEAAIRGGKNTLIDGRRCRTEQAKVNRSLYLSRLTGGSISTGEARITLQRYGSIEEIWRPSKTDKEMYQLPDGVWIKFAYFQDCRDAQADFREHQMYRLEQPAMPPNLRTRPTRSSQFPIGSLPNSLNRTSPARMGYQDRHTIMRKEFDRCSVFVGDLPSNVTQAQLNELFGRYGRVVSIDLISKPSVNSSRVNLFAFIEFSSEEEALFAVGSEDQKVIEGQAIRVEYKDSGEAGSRRTSPLARRIGINHYSGSPDRRQASHGDLSYDRRAALQQLYTQSMVYGTPQLSGVDILAVGTRQTSVGDGHQAVAPHAPVYPVPIPYAYYAAQYAPFHPATAQNQYATYDSAPTEENTSAALSPNGTSFSPSGQSHAGYYPQSAVQPPTITGTHTQTQTAIGNGVHQMVPQQVASQQPMGQFQYPQGPLGYPQYHPGYYQYATNQNGTTTPVIQYVYQQNDDRSQSVGNPTAVTRATEASESP
ncbi:MAG: hypothetical protein M1827_007364 [Pycnora praestabilis]|nr:MAG: hypothetical protein M1827_007364 [Pycnora praestabilis]